MADTRPTASVYVWDNGRGLTRDLRIILDLLQLAGFDTTVEATRPHERGVFYRAHIRKLVARPTRDVNLFLERLVPSDFHRARQNVLIPNQEWLPPTDLRLLPFLDLIACRSRLATELFSGRGPMTEYIGFTSEDRRVPDLPKGDGILHIAGQSQFKGTAALLRVWQRHPEWPTLTLVHRSDVAPVVEGAGNIQQFTEYLADDELKRLQQRAWLHIQPSEAEGFGHCLCEGMSAGAIVLTVDAAPMNELITPDRGVLVPWRESEPMGVDRRYLVDEAQLEGAIGDLIAAGPGAGATRMKGARDWYVSNDTRFRRKFVDLFRRLGTRETD